MSNIFKIIQYEEEEKMMAKFLKTGLFELQYDNLTSLVVGQQYDECIHRSNYQSTTMAC